MGDGLSAVPENGHGRVFTLLRTLYSSPRRNATDPAPTRRVTGCIRGCAKETSEHSPDVAGEQAPDCTSAASSDTNRNPKSPTRS